MIGSTGSHDNDKRGESKRTTDASGKHSEDDTRRTEEYGKGVRKRIHSELRKPQGEAGDERKIRSDQRGLSNAPTMHSTDQMANPEQSKKPEGTPDSAKYPGTINPQR